MKYCKVSTGLLQISMLALALVFFCACKKNNAAIDYSQRTAYYKNIHSINYTDSVIKCVTFNIQLGFSDADPWNSAHIGGTPGHIQKMKEYIDVVKPDIICLQEVPRNRYNTEVKNFIETLATTLNMNYAFGSNGYNDPYGIEPVKGEWGNAILSKYPITAISNVENEYESIWERRSILTADMVINGKTIRVHSLHFLPTANAENNALLYFKRTSGLPQLIMGDFNLSRLPLLEANQFTDVFKADAVNGMLFNSIDRILHTKDQFTTLNMGYISDSIFIPRYQISDHLANYATLKLK